MLSPDGGGKALEGHMGTGLRSASTVSIAVGIALLGALLVSSSVVAIKGTEAWGWVVARQPSTTQYTPAAKDQGNSGGGTNTVHRASVGDYTVLFGDLDTTNVVIHVSTLGTSPRICTVGDHGFLDPDFVAEVICFDRHGALADSAFVVNILAQFNASDDMGYVYATQIGTGEYQPEIAYNSADKLNSVKKLGEGRWKVTLPGIGGAAGRGSVQVTAAIGTAAVCRVVSWEGGVVARVACRDADGDLVDTQFMLTYMRGRGLKFEGDPKVAYVLADKPTTASYHSTPGYRFSTAGESPIIKRSGTGQYSVTLPGMPLGGGAQVTAYGPGGKRCIIGAIRSSVTPQRVDVRCFTASGKQRADSAFVLHYAR
jgi:hypothetical protein